MELNGAVAVVEYRADVDNFVCHVTRLVTHLVKLEQRQGVGDADDTHR